MGANMKKQFHETAFALVCKNFFNSLYNKLNKTNPAKFYLVCAIVLGGILIFVTPPFQVPDEGAHFYRAYQISEGGFLPEHLEEGTGGTLPRSLQVVIDTSIPSNMYGNTDVKADPSLIKKALSQPLNADDRIETSFDNTALYSPIMYAPASLGIAISRAFGATPLVMLYVGRIFMLAAWVAALYFAIRILPYGKWAMAVLALSPMAIYQCASVSADAVALSMGALVVAWFVKLATQESCMSKKQWFLTLSLLLALGFVKQPYSLLGLSFAFLPSRLFISKKQKWQFIVSALVVVIGVTATWYLVSTSYYSVPAWISATREINPNKQLLFLLTHPWTFLHALANTHLSTYSDGLIMQAVGVFGSLEAPLPLWADLSYMFALLLAIGVSYGQKIMQKTQRILLFTLTALSFLAIDVLLYMSWSPYAALDVWGLQGRYYLVAMPGIVLPLIGSLEVKFRRVKSQFVIISLALIVLITSFLVILKRFWIA